MSIHESISQPVVRIGCYKVQIAPPCGFGWVRLSVEPADDFHFSDARAEKVEDRLAGRIVPAILSALEPFRSRGPAWGYPLRVHVRLLETKLHIVDSHPEDYGRAAVVALADAVRAYPVCLVDEDEPAGPTRLLIPWALPRHHTVTAEG